jgi:hypothetical protein
MIADDLLIGLTVVGLVLAVGYIRAVLNQLRSSAGARPEAPVRGTAIRSRPTR